MTWVVLTPFGDAIAAKVEVWTRQAAVVCSKVSLPTMPTIDTSSSATLTCGSVRDGQGARNHVEISFGVALRGPGSCNVFTVAVLFVHDRGPTDFIFRAVLSRDDIGRWFRTTLISNVFEMRLQALLEPKSISRQLQLTNLIFNTVPAFKCVPQSRAEGYDSATVVLVRVETESVAVLIS